MLSIPRCNAGCNPLRAELIGSDRCTVPGFTPTSSAPILALCRTLIAAGFNPTTPLECYRAGTLALRVRSIGEGARLRVATHGVGFEAVPECTGAPPVGERVPEAAEIGDGQ